jgi:pentatricopeptide repeat protein
MYAKCGALAKAQDVFEELLVKDTVAWNALIAGYVREGQGWKALDCFRCMRSEGFSSPDAATLACLSKACGSTRSLHMGERIHEEIASKGLLAKDAVLGNAVVDMYVKCGMLEKAEEVVLRELPIRDAVSWTSLIAGYVERGRGREALACFERMQSEGIAPDAVTFICILKACGITRAIGKGKQIHDEIMDRGLLRSSIILGTALVDMYVKCGALATARRVLLEELQARDVVSWVAVIAGYASEQGELDGVLSCFESMEAEGLPPTLAVFTCILKACGNVGAVDVGKCIHDEIARLGLLEQDPASMLGTALVDMYARCGALVRAQNVLEELPIRDVASWSALIAGYAREGRGNEALECLSRMQSEGIAPDELTFASIVKAWAHEGLNPTSENRTRDLGHGYDNITPSLEHHTAMVSGFGSLGHFDKAMEVIYLVPCSDARIELWLALMGACRKWGNVELARLSFDRALEIDRNCSVAYVLMLEIFAAVGMHEDAESVEAMRSKHCVG